MNRHHVWLVARRELVDIRRSGGIFVTMLLVPIAFVAFIALIPSWLEGRQDDELRHQVFDVAYDGHIPATLIARAEEAKLRFTEVSDVRAAVEDKDAHVGMVVMGVPSEDEPSLRLEVPYLASRISSLRALDRLVQLVQADTSAIVAERLAARSVPPSAAEPIEIDEKDLSGSPEGSRLSLARAMALLIAFPFTNWVSAVGNRLGGSKDARTLEPILVLPIARRDLLLGVATGSGLFALLTLPAVALPLLLTTLRPFGRTATPVELSVSMLPYALLGGLLFGVIAISFGLVMGSVSHTSGGLASAAPFITIIFTVTAIAMQITSVYAQWWSTLIPIAGPLALAQQGIAGSVSWWSPLAAIATTAAIAFTALRVATRFLDTDRSVLRATS